MAKSVSTILPYPSLPMGQLVLSVDEETKPTYLNQTAFDSYIVAQETAEVNFILKSSFQHEKRIRGQLSLGDPSQGITLTEQLNREIGLCIVSNSVTSRYRSATLENKETEGINLLNISDSQQGIPITLNSEDFRGALKITAYLVYREGHKFEYKRCATSNELALYFTDHETLPGGGIENEWKKFSEDSDFEKYSNQYFKLTYSGTSDKSPKLWLNQSFQDFHDVMQSSANSGVRAKARHVMEHSIASRVAHSLLSDSLEELAVIPKEDLEGYEDTELLEQFDHIQIQLLKEFVADIGWGDTFEAGLRLVGHSTPSKDITELASDFVQRKFEASEPFPRLLELLEA